MFSFFLQDFLFHCREGNIAEAVKMIQHSADVLLLKDEEGVSGLLWACDRGHTELVLELLNAGFVLFCFFSLVI